MDDKTRNRLIAVAYGVLFVGLSAYSVQPATLVTPLEAVGFLFGLLWIWFLIKENPWCWLAGIVSSSAYVVFLLQSKLFGDAMLNGIYVALNALGWYWWLKGERGQTPLRISRTPLKMAVIIAVLAVATTAILQKFFQDWGNTTAIPDAALFATAIAGQFLQTRKKIENWPLWVFVDFGYAALMIVKGFYPTAILNSIYGVLAIKGWFDWRHRLKRQEPDAIEATGS